MALSRAKVRHFILPISLPQIIKSSAIFSTSDFHSTLAVFKLPADPPWPKPRLAGRCINQPPANNDPLSRGPLVVTSGLRDPKLSQSQGLLFGHGRPWLFITRTKKGGSLGCSLETKIPGFRSATRYTIRLSL